MARSAVERAGSVRMNVLLLLAGLALLVPAFVDALWTTLWIDGGAGPVTRRVVRAVRGAMARAASGRHGMLSLSGPIALVSTLGVWVVLVWGGWALALLSTPHAVVWVSSREPTGVVERVYFAGYTTFTLGNGEFTPGSGPWQIATAAASGTGLILLTMGITYVVTILSAVVDQRAFATQVTSLGHHPADFVCAAWPSGSARWNRPC